MAVNESSHDWPPESGEPITPGTVVARLDDLGWSPDCTTLIDHSRDVALVSYKSVYPDRFVLLLLTDGHEIAAYSDAGSGRDMIRRLRAREQEDEGSNDDAE